MRKRIIEVPLRLIELEKSNYHIMLDVVFEDGTIGMWIVDTGASKTVADSAIEKYVKRLDSELTSIESMGIGNTKIESKAGVIPSLFLGTTCICDTHVVIIDLSAVNEQYQKFTNQTISGLVGSDFLVAHKAIIDYKKLKINLFV